MARNKVVVALEWELLGTQALSCKGWRWMPGMLDNDGDRCCAVESEAVFVGSDTLACTGAVPVKGHLGHIPDLSDPATVGCLLALVREAWGDRAAGLSFNPCGRAKERWEMSSGVDDWGALDDLPGQGSEAAALVAALRAAP